MECFVVPVAAAVTSVASASGQRNTYDDHQKVKTVEYCREHGVGAAAKYFDQNLKGDKQHPIEADTISNWMEVWKKVGPTHVLIESKMVKRKAFWRRKEPPFLGGGRRKSGFSGKPCPRICAECPPGIETFDHSTFPVLCRSQLSYLKEEAVELLEDYMNEVGLPWRSDVRVAIDVTDLLLRPPPRRCWITCNKGTGHLTPLQPRSNAAAPCGPDSDPNPNSSSTPNGSPSPSTRRATDSPTDTTLDSIVNTEPGGMI